MVASELEVSSSLTILDNSAYKASGSLRIASKGELFFLDLVEDDVLARCWYVKWWDRFSHTDSIINNVERDFLASQVSPLKITTPVQTAATDAPASSSTDAPASLSR